MSDFGRPDAIDWTSPRFFVAPADIADHPNDGWSISIRGEEARHGMKVLRLTPGDTVVVLDGTGYEYVAVLTDVTRDASGGTMAARSSERRRALGEPPFSLTLIQALPKGDKMGTVIQKGTEVGITRFRPVASRRSVVRYDAERAQSRVERWQRIAHEAAKQAGRGLIPVIEPIVPVADAIAAERAAGAQVLLFWEEAHTSLRDALTQLDRHRQDPLAFVIGPEGGFPADEVKSMAAAGCSAPVSLGPRVLRTETAGPVAGAILLYELAGDQG